jgi:hypothetical protein
MHNNCMAPIQMLELNNALGTTERVQGGFFTAAIQDDWSGAFPSSFRAPFHSCSLET